MSDIALNQAKTMINCVITLIESDMWPPKSPDLNPVDYAVWGLFNSWSINVDNLRQSTSWSRRSSLSRANCPGVWLITPLVNGVAGLSVPSSSKGDAWNIWCENCEMWQLLWTITETINRLFPVVIFYNLLLQITFCFQLLLLRRHWNIIR